MHGRRGRGKGVFVKFEKHIPIEREAFAADLLSAATGLSKTTVKDCLTKGAVWLKRPGKKEQRIRKAKFRVLATDRLSLYYDETILSQPVPEPQCIAREKNYSIWNKPAGLLSQGTRYGDHCSLLRFAQKAVNPSPALHLVHRLDREAQGLVLLAHNSFAAAQFSEYFRSGKIDKRYEAVAEGLLAREKDVFRIDEMLDGKSANTVITVVRHDQLLHRSLLDIKLLTGRYHQIRRHLSGIGHPLVGDLRYGGKKDSEGLKLKAYSLSFICPFSRQKRQYSLK